MGLLMSTAFDWKHLAKPLHRWHSADVQPFGNFDKASGLGGDWKWPAHVHVGF